MEAAIITIVQSLKWVMVITLVIIAFFVVRGVSLKRRGSGPGLRLTRPTAGEVYLSSGYDYETRSYKMWMSPLFDLPDKQEQMDAYLALEPVLQTQFFDQPATEAATVEARAKLEAAGWSVMWASPPDLLVELPSWMRSLGHDMKDRDERKDHKAWRNRHKEQPIHPKLIAQMDEARDKAERLQKSDEAFADMMKPHPSWVHRTNGTSPCNRLSHNEIESKRKG